MIKTFFFGTPVSQDVPSIEKEKESAALTIYQRHHDPNNWLARGQDLITAQREYWFPDSKPPKTSIFSNAKKLDPTDFSNACKILGVSENESSNLELIHKRYEEIMSSLRQRHSQLSGPLASQLQLLMDDVQSAYITLMQPKQ